MRAMEPEVGTGTGLPTGTTRTPFATGNDGRPEDGPAMVTWWPCVTNSAASGST